MIGKMCGVLVLFVSTLFGALAGPAELDEMGVVAKSNEMMVQHPSYHALNRDLAKRLLVTFCEQMDPLKVYLLKDEVAEWMHPSQEMEERVITSFQEGTFTPFESMFLRMEEAIARRHLLDKRVDQAAIPEKVRVRVNEFDWADSVDGLVERLILLRSVQLEAISHLDASLRENGLWRLKKQQHLFEQHRLPEDAVLFSRTLCTFIMKAFAEALDSESAFYTPAEAMQLVVGLQQRLFGIGVLIRDDADGFSVIKIVEGGPADQQGGLVLGDKIIAIDNQPVIGLDILDAVELIRGQPGSLIDLKVLRKDEKSGKMVPLHLSLHRGEVVVKESRYSSQVKPIDNGVLGYLRLHSFYEDSDASSCSDLRAALCELKEKQDVKGLILDLRCNPGGYLKQAVGVAGLFLDKGIVVSTPDEEGNLIHSRNLAGKKEWNGPLIVLMNRGSASASEVVAQVLQDWGRAIIIGDDRSFGKGSFQVFTLSADGRSPNPQGEYKVTRGRYYTVSGKSPQLVGVRSDIVVPGILGVEEIGEEFLKFPLSADTIDAHFVDAMEDLPFFQGALVRKLYASSEQKTTAQWTVHIPELKKRSEQRMKDNVPFQEFVSRLQSRTQDFEENPKEVDFQLEEAWKVLEDLLQLSGEAQVRVADAA